MGTVRTLEMLLLGVALAAGAAAQGSVVPRVSKADLRAVDEWVPAAAPVLRDDTRGFAFRRSPDGKQLAWLSQPPAAGANERAPRQFELVIAADAGPARAIPLHAAALDAERTAAAPHWSPDGSAIVVAFVAQEDGKAATCVQSVPVGGGEAREIFRGAGALRGFAMAADGRTLALQLLVIDSEHDGRPELALALLDGGGGTRRLETFGCTAAVSAAVSFAPDGKRLAVVVDAQLYRLDVDGGKPQRVGTIAPLRCCVQAPQWRYDGKELLLVGDDRVAQADLEHGVRRSWSRRELGGDVRAAVAVPHAEFFAVVVDEEYEPPLLEFVMSLAEAPTQHFAGLSQVAWSDGSVRAVPVRRQRLADRACLPYLPRISELLARCSQ